MECKNCKCSDCIKKGIRKDRQKYYCRTCNKYFQSIYSYKLCTTEDEKMIVRLTTEGMSICGISRITGISKANVINKITLLNKLSIITVLITVMLLSHVNLYSQPTPLRILSINSVTFDNYYLIRVSDDKNTYNVLSEKQNSKETLDKNKIQIGSCYSLELSKLISIKFGDLYVKVSEQMIYQGSLIIKKEGEYFYQSKELSDGLLIQSSKSVVCK